MNNWPLEGMGLSRYDMNNNFEKDENIQSSLLSHLAYFGVPYFQNDVRDKITPIVIDFKFDLVERRSNRRRREVLPILNQRSRTSVSAEVR